MLYMSELKIQTTIEGEHYSQDQLARLQYERQKHVLHQLKLLGVKILKKDQELTHDQIDFLSAEEARKISIDTRLDYQPEQIRDLFKNQIAQSDKMWKNINKGFQEGDPMQKSQTDFKVVGLTLEGFQKMYASLNGSDESRKLELSMNPEHYYMYQSAGKMHVMEAFGMYGQPTANDVTPNDPSLVLPEKRDPEYPNILTGKTRLTSDNTDIHLYAVHQFKPLKDGMAVKSAVYFPTNTPKEIIKGHQIHLAVEFSEGIKIAYQNFR